MKNLAGLMKQAQQMQEKMQELQARLEAMELEGESGAGLVQGDAERQERAASHEDRPQDGRSDDTEMLEDLIVAAHRDAKAKIEAATAEEMQKISGGLQLPPGMKLPF